MKKILTWILVTVLFFWVSVFAADHPDSFQVEVNPSSFAINQPVDMTIKAIKNGQIMKNFEGQIYIQVLGDGIGVHDYTVPEIGLGEMKLVDQGTKTYSKGLQIKKPGNYRVRVEDFMLETIFGETTVIVSSDQQETLRTISFYSPLQNGTETEAMMSVMASAPELVNSRIQIYLNDLMVKEGMTDANGLLNETIPLQKAGTNVIELKAVSVNNQVVGASEKRTFLYQPSNEELFKSVAMTPNQELKIWDKVRFELFTDERVSSAKLAFSGAQEFPLDKEKDGLFAKEIMLTTTGTLQINAELIAGTTTKNYENILIFPVKDHIKIGEVRMVLNPNAAATLDLSWAVIGGESKDYAIKYGLEKENLAGVLFTQEPKASIGSLAYGKSYFFQIMATTPEHIPEGLPSEVIQYDLPILWGTGSLALALSGNLLTTDEPHAVAPVLDVPTCVVKNISFTTKKIGNKYYLVRNQVENVQKYLVYRSDFADGSNRQFVGETTVPRFEYPFDKTSEEDVYAYYRIEAVCSDGKNLVLTEAEKVKVWPFEDMLMILAATFLLYLMYRLYTYRVD